MDFYWVIFTLMCVVAGGLLVVARDSGIAPQSGPNIGAYKRHMAIYVVIYSLMMCECTCWRGGP